MKPLEHHSPAPATPAATRAPAPSAARRPLAPAITASPGLSPLAKQRLLSATALVAFFLLWELGCLASGISDLVLPRPSQIAAVLVDKAPLLWPHTVQTLYTTTAGFVLGVLAGVLIGVVIGSSKLAYNVAYPLLVGFSSIPKVAVVPIFVVWFGAGTVPAILTSMVISIFPVVVNVATGLATTEPELEDVFKVLGASKRDILWNVGLPRALPYLFASLKIAITLAFVGTVLSETVAANKGIGNVMMIASGNFDVPLVFAGLIILAALGVALYGVFALFESRLTGWTQRKADLPA
ncbi:ABC transporter permease [Aquincola sp. MAHUQ-54]|uniref:ABC transporter permease n=1 Tax=Aquincola agrisoli TaxID=3119538 RepID=A0AAW9QPX3_9BURK